MVGASVSGLDHGFKSNDGVVVVYDIFWKQSTGTPPVKSHEHEYVKFKPLASLPSPLLSEGGIDWESEEGELDEWGDPENGTHRAYVRFADWRAKYSCEISDYGTAFSYFDPLWWNKAMDQWRHGGHIAFKFVDTKDDDGYCFPKLKIDGGPNHGCSNGSTVRLEEGR
ncbi:uncharacterized protein PAC_00297 [Phialocephala subalpina]|uniref:Uncharacterized protein n=1 Tax=Phialocephala subalpina TaxID=576137 RepID=A0A1L7WCB9_9HELO|nr:uncharacterized protein PAC_00297 [Phialocephala subalpina]